MFLIGVFLGNYVYDEHAHINYRQHANNQIGIAMSARVRMKKRLQRIMKKDKRIQERSITSFLDSYKSHLTSDDVRLLGRVAFYKQSIWKRMTLLFSKRFTLNSFEKSLFVKLKIILGSL